jgi:hypothetical protein
VWSDAGFIDFPFGISHFPFVVAVTISARSK